MSRAARLRRALVTFLVFVAIVAAAVFFVHGIEALLGEVAGWVVTGVMGLALIALLYRDAGRTPR